MLRRLLQSPSGTGSSGLHRGHALLAAGVCAAALWAYLVTHPLSGAAPTGPGAVRVWDVSPRTVAALEYHAPGTERRLEATWDDGAEPYLWITATTAPRETKADAKSPAKADAKAGAGDPQDAAKAAAAPPPAPIMGKGSAAAGRILAQFSTLYALRDLGRLDDQNAATFGLTAPEVYLQLQPRQGPPLRLNLGRATFGEAGRYAHNPADGHVYLLRAADLRLLTGAPGALIDRELLGLPTKDTARIVLALGGQERTFYRLTEPGAWGDTADVGEGVADMGALVVLLDRLKLARYAPEGAGEGTDVLGNPALVLRLYREGEREPAVLLELFAPQDRSALARSSHTRKLVELNVTLVRQVLEKARALIQRT